MALLDQSLLQQTEGPGGEPRFTMLETIREYAVERLGASRETEAIRQQHAAYFLELAQAADPHLQGADQAMWLERLETVAGARDQLGESRFTAAWAKGWAMPLEQAIGYARDQTRALEAVQTPPPSAAPVAPSPAYPAGLTARELEILRLVAQGLTDAQVAERLVISPRTVDTHLTAIYGKLGVTSRSAATRFAVEHHLV